MSLETVRVILLVPLAALAYYDITWAVFGFMAGSFLSDWWDSRETNR